MPARIKSVVAHVLDHVPLVARSVGGVAQPHLTVAVLVGPHLLVAGPPIHELRHWLIDARAPLGPSLEFDLPRCLTFH